MKFELVIKDASIDELVELLTSPGLPSAVRKMLPNVPGNSNEDDDESGDTPAPVAPGTVDGTGMPWDERIHSNPPSLTKKNVWRRRKGVDDATIAAVEAELRARATPTMQPGPVMTTPQPVQQPQMQQPVMQMPAGYPAPQPVQQQPVMQMPTSVAPPPQQPATTGIPVASTPNVQPQQMQPVAPPPAGTVDFAGFMNKVSQLVSAGVCDSNYFAGLCQRIVAAYNNTIVLNSIADFQNNQAVLDYAIQVMASEGRWI